MAEENRKPGLLKTKSLDRKSGNFEPRIPYEEEESTKKERGSKSKFPNQTASLKIPQSTKNELFALRTLTQTKFDYEMIQTLIDQYVNRLDTAEYKKFKLLLEIQEK